MAAGTRLSDNRKREGCCAISILGFGGTLHMSAHICDSTASRMQINVLAMGFVLQREEVREQRAKAAAHDR
jgi:hypothetical protein